MSSQQEDDTYYITCGDGAVIHLAPTPKKSKLEQAAPELAEELLRLYKWLDDEYGSLDRTKAVLQRAGVLE